MKKTLLGVLILAPLFTFGTNQIKEKIIYNGRTEDLLSFPLSEALVVKARHTNQIRSSACWRGYVGLWEIRDKTLYLVRLQDVKENIIPADQLIDGETYPIQADWFTGELRIGTERLGITAYSTEVFLSLTNGVISSEPEVIDRETERDAFKETLAGMKDSPEQLERDLYEYMYHYKGSRESNLKLNGLLTVTSEQMEEVKLPYCRTFTRVDEPAEHIRSYIRFLPTTEPRLYKVESAYRKLNDKNSIHYVGFLKDTSFSLFGQPYEKTVHKKENGQMQIIKTSDPEKAGQEAFDTMIRFRKMLKGRTVLPEERAFNLAISLSTNVFRLNDSLTIALTVSNSGSEPVSLCAYDLDIEFLLQNNGGTNITEYGRSDWIVREIEFPMVLKPGESKRFGLTQVSYRSA